MVSYRPIRQLSDLTRIGANLRLTCLACGHTGVMHAGEVTSYFVAKRWNLAWETAAARFSCYECKGRDIRLEVALIPQAPAPMQPITIDREEKRKRSQR